MKVAKFDFNRLYEAWDDSLVGKKCIISDSIDDIFDAVENGKDWCCFEPETVEQRDERYAAFRSIYDGNSYRYAYVLDEDFIDELLARVEWTRADVRASLYKRITDRDVTDDDIDAVIDDIDWEQVEDTMISNGWIFVDTASDEYVRGFEE